MGDNLYDILGVDKDATDEEIKAAYRNKAKKNHTDVGGDNDKMVAITKAYSVLKDPKKKEHYDNTGQEQLDGFDKRFRAFIQEIFIKIVETDTVDVEHMDLIDLFKQNLGGMLSNGQNLLNKTERNLKKMRSALERVTAEKDSAILEVMNGNVQRLEKEINLIELDIEFVEDCLEVLNSYHYKFDQRESPMNFHAGGTFSFGI